MTVQEEFLGWATMQTSLSTGEFCILTRLQHLHIVRTTKEKPGKLRRKVTYTNAGNIEPMMADSAAVA